VHCALPYLYLRVLIIYYKDPGSDSIMVSLKVSLGSGRLAHYYYEIERIRTFAFLRDNLPLVWSAEMIRRCYYNKKSNEFEDESIESELDKKCGESFCSFQFLNVLIKRASSKSVPTQFRGRGAPGTRKTTQLPPSLNHKLGNNPSNPTPHLEKHRSRKNAWVVTN
jgi:hypothetical protein